MSGDLEKQLARARHWALETQAEGWLSLADISPLIELGDRTPAALFEAGVHRPLVVAFFGGTGVGKSSLLNRLAGQDVARVGVERPTSREISIYAHDSVHLRQLPDGMPLDRVRFAHHADERRRQVLWVDMPDIDSTARENRDLVIQWLPHVDVLVYVVSPERYRDDKGWRLLQEQGGSHAWLFVMNQWDRGCPEQFDDFGSLLRRGGFAEPIMLTTCCRRAAGTTAADEFDRLEDIIQSLADHHVVEQLERRSLMLRQRALRDAMEGCLLRMGADDDWQRLDAEWSSIWQETHDLLLEGLAWPIQELAQRYVSHEANPFEKSIRLDSTPRDSEESGKSPSVLWDGWAAMQLGDAVNRLVIESSLRQGAGLLRAALDLAASGAARHVESRAQLVLRQALANPGNSLQRFFLRLTGVAALLLPLCAIGWVSWEAVAAYYASGQTHVGYLGVDFAIHSGLLIVIAWLLPYFLNRQLRPSTERVARRGLKSGVEQGFLRIEHDIQEAIAGARRRCFERKAEAWAQLSEFGDDANVDGRDEMLTRMLPGKSPGSVHKGN